MKFLVTVKGSRRRGGVPGARVGCVYGVCVWGGWGGQGMRACNRNFAVLVQRLIEGKWSHVL